MATNETWRAGWGIGVTGGNCPGGEPFVKRGWPYTIVRSGDQTVAIVPAEVGNIEERGTPSKAVNGSEVKRASLIAAAPDLLDALRECVDSLRNYEKTDQGSWNDDVLNARDMARAAIAKAEGR